MSDSVRNRDHKPFWVNAHREDVVFSGRGELLGRHQAGLGLNKKLAMFVSFLNAVGNFGVGPDVPIRRDHPIHGVSLCGSLSLGSLALWQSDLVDLLQEERPVVVVVQDLDDDADGGGFGRNAVVGDGYLRRHDKDFSN